MTSSGQCPACGSSDVLLGVEISGFQLAQCNACGADWLVQVSQPAPATATPQRSRSKRLAAPPNNYVANPRLVEATAASSAGPPGANHLWIQTGKMSGPPEHRHQIEFAGDLVGFFVQPIRGSEWIPIRLASGGEVLWRPLTARGTDYGQWTAIWRLGLPTPQMKGPVYVDRIVKFTRRRSTGLTDGVNVIFELEVEDETSPEAASWRELSQKHGTMGRTGAGRDRAFGWW